MQRLSLIKCIALLLVIIPTISIAAISTSGFKSGYKYSENMCHDAGNELDISSCLSAELNRASSYLDKLNKKVKVEIKKRSLTGFDEVIKAWKAYVKTNCEFESSSAAGNSSATIYVNCELQYTLNRIRQLEQYEYCLKGRCEEPVRLYLMISPIKY